MICPNKSVVEIAMKGVCLSRPPFADYFDFGGFSAAIADWALCGRDTPNPKIAPVKYQTTRILSAEVGDIIGLPFFTKLSTL